LAKADRNDAEAKSELSLSYNKLGDVHLKLGSTDKALDYDRKGLELSEALAKADPNDAQANRDLSVSYGKLVDAHLQLGSTDKALELYRKHLELSEALAMAEPATASRRQLLASADGNRGLASGARYGRILDENELG
jgi:pentatricopeptide repeat protein